MDAYDDTVSIPLVWKQATLFDGPEQGMLQPGAGEALFSAPHVDVRNYDGIIVCMSGGKDSIASLLLLLEMGVDRSRVELWHHDVDGHEGRELMDWPFMADYLRKFAQAFEMPLYFSWLEGGFEGELLKDNAFSKPHRVETPDGLIVLARDTRRSAPGTRRRFPQLSANLQTRWCSSALKIDVGRRALNNQQRFDHSRTLFVTGERREESANRARYFQFETHACDRRSGNKARHVDAWRPVLAWSERDIWEKLRAHNVLPPVPYRLGWNRSSCFTCIYNSQRTWATIGKYFPARLDAIANYETLLGTTISREQINVRDIAAAAAPFDIEYQDALMQASLKVYELPIFSGTNNGWKMPAGAFSRHQSGPQ